MKASQAIPPGTNHKQTVLELITCNLNKNKTFTTASRSMGKGCLGYPGASTVTSRPLDSATLLWLEIPTTHEPLHSLPDTCHTNRGDGEGREDRKKSTFRPGNC